MAEDGPITAKSLYNILTGNQKYQTFGGLRAVGYHRKKGAFIVGRTSLTAQEVPLDEYSTLEDGTLTVDLEGTAEEINRILERKYDL